VWFVLRSVLRKRQILRDVVVKASAPREGVTPWEAFGRELLARGGSADHAVDHHELIQREGRAHALDARSLVAAPQLTAQEREVLLALYPPPNGPPADKLPPESIVDTPAGSESGYTFPALVAGADATTLS